MMGMEWIVNMKEIRENVKRNLGYYLSLRGMSQKNLADALGVTQAAVTNWIKGKNSPGIETVAQICTILDISVSDLFGMAGDSGYSDHERELINRYRSSPQLRHAVDILLGISPGGQ